MFMVPSREGVGSGVKSRTARAPVAWSKVQMGGKVGLGGGDGVCVCVCA